MARLTVRGRNEATAPTASPPYWERSPGSGLLGSSVPYGYGRIGELEGEGVSGVTVHWGEQRDRALRLHPLVFGHLSLAATRCHAFRNMLKSRAGSEYVPLSMARSNSLGKLRVSQQRPCFVTQRYKSIRSSM